MLKGPHRGPFNIVCFIGLGLLSLYCEMECTEASVPASAGSGDGAE